MLSLDPARPWQRAMKEPEKATDAPRSRAAPPRAAAPDPRDQATVDPPVAPVTAAATDGREPRPDAQPTARPTPPRDADAGAAAPLNLSLPPPARGRADSPPPTVAELARRDPRSNAVRLSLRERIDIAMGHVACVLEVKDPDGTVRRIPGRIVDVAALGAVGARGGTVPMCVE
jgi:hypothetical protein